MQQMFRSVRVGVLNIIVLLYSQAPKIQECSCWCLELMIDAEVLGARENQVQLFHAVAQRAVHHLERGPQILESQKKNETTG